MVSKNNEEEISVDVDAIKRFHRKGRYAVTKNGYVFDRYLFRFFCISFIILASFIIGADYYNGTLVNAWAYCPEDAIGGRCTNGLYGQCDLPACQKEFLLPGEEIGERPSGYSISERFTYFMFFSLALVFILNHLFQRLEGYKNARNNNKE